MALSLARHPSHTVKCKGGGSDVGQIRIYVRNGDHAAAFVHVLPPVVVRANPVDGLHVNHSDEPLRSTVRRVPSVTVPLVTVPPSYMPLVTTPHLYASTSQINCSNSVWLCCCELRLHRTQGKQANRSLESRSTAAWKAGQRRRKQVKDRESR